MNDGRFPNFDAQLDPDHGEPVRSRSPKFVWCTSCKTDDAAAGQRKCRRCGSTKIEHRGGQVMHGRRDD